MHINLDVLYIQAACGSRGLPPVYWKNEFTIYYKLYVLFKEKVYVCTYRSLPCNYMYLCSGRNKSPSKFNVLYVSC